MSTFINFDRKLLYIVAIAAVNVAQKLRPYSGVHLLRFDSLLSQPSVIHSFSKAHALAGKPMSTGEQIENIIKNNNYENPN